MTYKILIVDDTPKNLDLLHHCLREANFKVLVAQNGEAALNRVDHIKPDLILLDVNMPGMDGFETCRRLKQKEVTKNIPVIFLSVNDKTIDKIKGFDINAVDYITKPFDPVEVIARVQKHLGVYNVQKQLTNQNTHLKDQVHHLESLAILGNTFNQSRNIPQMMENAMKVTLDIFKCDRAWLLYPCDPNAASWYVPIEVTTPAYPGAHLLNTQIPMSANISEMMQDVLAVNEPFVFDATFEHRDIKIAQQFSIQSEIHIAIHPKFGKPWLFGLHQCAYARIWTENEYNLFQDFGHYITESLGLFLSIKILKTKIRNE